MQIKIYTRIKRVRVGRRNLKLIGKYIILPIVGREIPIITDQYVDPQFGTGGVKVTPAHDPNDFQMGERHDLKFINIMNFEKSAYH